MCSAAHAQNVTLTAMQDEALLFVSVRSASAAQVPKVLRVVEETKRLRHKSGEFSLLSSLETRLVDEAIE